MIKREKYMEPIREFYDGDLIKVITGIRRCGKSVILKQILEEINERSNNIIFLDFEDTAVLNAIPDEMALLSYVDSHRKESLCYVFLDEVQVFTKRLILVDQIRHWKLSFLISYSNTGQGFSQRGGSHPPFQGRAHERCLSRR